MVKRTIGRYFTVAAAAFFIASSALAQSSGNVTAHAFALGKGPGSTSFTSLLCGSAQLAVGQSAADPICKTITGDVTIDASGVTAIGDSKVTNAQLATMDANTTKCNAAAGTANPTNCTASTMRTNIGVVIGTNVQAWDTDLDCLSALSSSGIIARTGAGTCAVRTFTAPAAGITISNGDGVAGNPTLALANDLAALEGLGSTGFATRTAADTWAQRTLTAPAAGLTITNPAGIAGDPTFALANDLAALEGLTGTNTIYYRSGVDTWSPVSIGSGLTFTAGSLAATGGGGSSTPSPPQGRLTLVTATPVMTTTQSAKTTLYYTPYIGNQVPLWDGTTMTMTTFPELSIATTDTTKNPAAIGASKVNDWFIWNDGGTLRLSHGPDWTNDTTRSAGTALVMVNGVLLNNAAITNGPGASRGTFVGTTRSNASSQLDWIFGASGTAPWFGVWNMYNRVDVITEWYEGTASWSYNSATVRALNASSIARVSLVRGLDEDGISVFAKNYTDTNSGSAASFGFGINSTSTNTVSMQATAPSLAGVGSVQYGGNPGLGFNFIQETEKSSGAVSYAAYGNSALSSLVFKGRM